MSASASSAAPSSSVIVPVSSPHDPRAYRHLTLANGLQVLLVNDKPKSAAQREREAAGQRKQKAGGDADAEGGDSKPAVVALSVGVGSWSDPPAIPGLAHFCEHMLFMGPSHTGTDGG